MRKRTLLPLLLLVGCVGGEATQTRQPVTVPTPVPVPSPPIPMPPPRLQLDGVAVQGGLLRGQASAGAILTLNGKPAPVAADGQFLIGFDRDETPVATLAVTLPNGRTMSRQIAVRPREWRIEHVNAALRPGVSSEEFRGVRARELERIAAARAKDSGSGGWRQSFRWPAHGRISGVFGSQRVYRGEPGAYHSGVDIAAGAGAPVVAPADGMVVLAGPPQFSLEGNLVIIDHGMGLNSAFLHLTSVDVREGQKVAQGQRIGTVGATGRATGPHLHWSMKWRDSRIDPQTLAE